MSFEYVYLAHPYTAYNEDGSFNIEVMEWRKKEGLKVYHMLTCSGLCVFAPIAMTSELEKEYGHLDPKIWYSMDDAFVAKASALFVLKLPGWEDSNGVIREIRLAKNCKIPVIHLEHVKIL